MVIFPEYLVGVDARCPPPFVSHLFWQSIAIAIRNYKLDMCCRGVVQENQKARLFTAVAYENIEQDIARGKGEYLTSLAVLLKIPSGKKDEFMVRSQSNYSILFVPDLRTAEKLLATLNSKREDFRADSQRLE